MENAAKALLIIGEILIGVIILSIMVMLFSRMGEISQEFSSKAEKREIVMFNTEFSKYQTSIDKPYLTPEEVVTLINKVYSWNKSTEYNPEEISLKVNNVEVTVNSDNLTITDRADLIEFLKAHKKYNDVFNNLDMIKSNSERLSSEEFDIYLKQFEDTKFTCQITYDGPKGRVNMIIIETITD